MLLRLVEGKVTDISMQYNICLNRNKIKNHESK